MVIYHKKHLWYITIILIPISATSSLREWLLGDVISDLPQPGLINYNEKSPQPFGHGLKTFLDGQF